MGNRAERREVVRSTRAAMAERRDAASATLERIPVERWPLEVRMAGNVLDVWMSKDFLVQIFTVPGHPSMERLTVNRVAITGIPRNGRVQYADGISWDDLQAVKHAVGRGGRWAVEVYPADAHEVCVANMRHLWLVDGGTLPWAWRAPA